MVFPFMYDGCFFVLGLLLGIDISNNTEYYYYKYTLIGQLYPG